MEELEGIQPKPHPDADVLDEQHTSCPRFCKNPASALPATSHFATMMPNAEVGPWAPLSSLESPKEKVSGQGSQEG